MHPPNGTSNKSAAAAGANGESSFFSHKNIFLIIVGVTALFSVVIQYQVYSRLSNISDPDGIRRNMKDKFLLQDEESKAETMADVLESAKKQEGRMIKLEKANADSLRREKENQKKEQEYMQQQADFAFLQAQYSATVAEKAENEIKLEKQITILEQQQKQFDKMAANYAKKDAQHAKRKARLAQQEAEVAEKRVEYEKKQVELARLDDAKNANEESAKILQQKLELLKSNEKEFNAKMVAVHRSQDEIMRKENEFQQKEAELERLEQERVHERKTLAERLEELKKSQMEYDLKFSEVNAKENEIKQREEEFTAKEREIYKIHEENMNSIREQQEQKLMFEKKQKEFQQKSVEFKTKEVDFKKQAELFQTMQNVLMGMKVQNPGGGGVPPTKVIEATSNEQEMNNNNDIPQLSAPVESERIDVESSTNVLPATDDNNQPSSNAGSAPAAVGGDNDNNNANNNSVIDCGCPQSCTSRALQKGNAAFTCGFRIAKMMEKYEIGQEKACLAASKTENDPCDDECNPTICKDMTGPMKHDVSSLDLHKPPFKRYKKVVMVTKVHWANDLEILQQTLCLFTAAYNRHVNYDIVVFTTLPWTVEQVKELQMIVEPAKLRVVQDGEPNVEEMLKGMKPEEVEALRKRCNVEDGVDLTWFHHCTEEGSKTDSNLAFAWQSEFRAGRIWDHEVMKNYKYMIWLDSDAFCTKTWEVDPMKIMIENNLVLLYDNTKGNAINPKLKEMQAKTYNGESICRVFLADDGTFNAKKCGQGGFIDPIINTVHGFHHITNLEFYRQKQNQNFLYELISQTRFSRQWDDQIAVTIPAAMRAPDRAWDMRSVGINQGVHHAGYLDGKDKNMKYSYIAYWNSAGKQNWEVGRKMCDGLIVNSG